MDTFLNDVNRLYDRVAAFITRQEHIEEDKSRAFIEASVVETSQELGVPQSDVHDTLAAAKPEDLLIPDLPPEMYGEILKHIVTLDDLLIFCQSQRILARECKQNFIVSGRLRGHRILNHLWKMYKSRIASSPMMANASLSAHMIQTLGLDFSSSPQNFLMQQLGRNPNLTVPALLHVFPRLRQALAPPIGMYAQDVEHAMQYIPFSLLQTLAGDMTEIPRPLISLVVVNKSTPLWYLEWAFQTYQVRIPLDHPSLSELFVFYELWPHAADSFYAETQAEALSRAPWLTGDMVDAHLDDVPWKWKILSETINCNIAFVRKHQSKLHFQLLSRNPSMDRKTMQANADLPWDWYYFAGNLSCRESDIAFVLSRVTEPAHQADLMFSLFGNRSLRPDVVLSHRQDLVPVPEHYQQIILRNPSISDKLFKEIMTSDWFRHTSSGQIQKALTNDFIPRYKL